MYRSCHKIGYSRCGVQNTSDIMEKSSLTNDKSEFCIIGKPHWEIGIPYIITVGRLAGEEICEFKTRSTMEKVEMPFGDAINTVVTAVKNIK